MPARSEKRGNDARNNRGVQAIFRWQPGQRGKGNALRQHQHGAQQRGLCICTQGGAGDLLHPAAKQPLQQADGGDGKRFLLRA
jgi:hypothetical protein